MGATHLLRRQTPPSVSASHPIASVMGCVGTSHADVALRASLGGDVIILPVLLETLSAVSPMVEADMIALILRAIPRVVSDFAPES